MVKNNNPPPFTLMTIHRFPVDLGSIGTILMFVAFVVLILSTKNIIKNIFSFIIKRQKLKKEIIRPILAIMVIFGNITLLNASVRSADNYAEKLANKIQIQCKQNNKCPKTISGFKQQQQQHKLITKYGEYGSKYYVAYILSEDMRAFNIRVRHDIDTELKLSGGVDSEIVTKENLR